MKGPASESILDLLERWESQGGSTTAVEVCRACPERAGELERLIDFVRRVEHLSTAAEAQDTDGPNLLPTLMPPESGLASPSTELAGGRYAIEGKLGEGGMGAVYRARDLQLGRTVALKVIRPELMTHAMQVRFEAEARAVATLDHPHVVKVFDVGRMPLPGESGPVPFLTLEYVEGGSLTRRLGGEALPSAEAARLVALLARAMEHAHERGIVHRDLKPDNVLLAPPSGVAALNTELGCPKISDFGLARQVAGNQRATAPGSVVGTPAYMAPEQAEGLPGIGPPADVWALGVILYRLVSGSLPFQSPSLVELLHQICRAELPSLTKSRPGVPAALAGIVEDCLRKKPGERPTAGALAARLEEWLRLGTADTTPDRVAEKPLAPRRQRGRLALAAALGVLVLAGLAWRFWPGPTVEERPVEPPDPPPSASKLRIRPLNVLHYETVGEESRQRGRMGEKSFAARHGDAVTLSVTLSEPGYCYVIGLNFDGREQLLWPTDDTGRPSEEVPPPRGEQVRIPGGDQRVYLDDPARSGLQAYVVLASSQPLPAFGKWREGRSGTVWKALPAGTSVWEADAKGTYEVVKGLTVDRGSIREAAGVPPLGRLCRGMLIGGVEAVEALAFPVLPRESK